MWAEAVGIEMGVGWSLGVGGGQEAGGGWAERRKERGDGKIGGQTHSNQC